MSPEARYPTTAEACAEVIKKFGWRIEPWMQDWPLEISHEIDLQRCIDQYPNIQSEDEKFLLMQGILYALGQVNDDVLLNTYAVSVRHILGEDFELHKPTIYYWTLYDNIANHLDEFSITPMAREVWNSKLPE